MPIAFAQQNQGLIGGAVAQTEAPEAPEVPSALEHLGRRISMLEEQAEMLASRLAPALINRPENVSGGHAVAPNYSSMLAIAIDDQAQRVSRICAVLERLNRDLAI